MRLSHLFFTTLRDDPAEAEMPSHRLLLRAGYVRPLGSGIYSLLPLGFRASKRVEQIIREEQDRIGAQEIEMPVVHPAEVWKESGRYFKIGPELVRFKDRGDRDMVLAMTHEEVVALLLRDIVQSYRQLPMMVYHFQTKFRDEPRSRGGLIRVREFVMKDAYSCDRDEAGLDKSYRDQYEAYERTFKRLGLDAIAVGADVGIMGGSGAHEFMVLNDFGEDTLVLCDSCGYAENQQIAEVRKPDPEPEDALPMEDVETPGATTIEALATFLGVAPQPDREGDVLRRPATAGSSSRSSGATTTSTRRSSSTRSRRPAGSARRPSRRSRPAAWRQATARRSARAMPSSSSTSWSCARRTSSPGRTGSAGT